MLDALHPVDYHQMTIIFPAISLHSQISLKETLASLGLHSLFKKREDDFDFAVMDFIQFTSFSLQPNEDETEDESAAILINRPFLFRLLNKNTSKPEMIGFISCPSSEESRQNVLCKAMASNCNRHQFCPRLDEICSLWNQCTKY